MTDITYAIIGFVVMIFGLALAFVRPWLNSKLNPEQLAMLRSFAKVAVSAAEQIITLVTGQEKKAWAMEQVKKLLAKFKLTFDEETVSAAIEEQVYEMNKEKDKNKPVGDGNE